MLLRTSKWTLYSNVVARVCFVQCTAVEFFCLQCLFEDCDTEQTTSRASSWIPFRLDLGKRTLRFTRQLASVCPFLQVDYDYILIMLSPFWRSVTFPGHTFSNSVSFVTILSWSNSTLAIDSHAFGCLKAIRHVATLPHWSPRRVGYVAACKAKLIV